jgi:hypothetical protein
VARPLSDRRVCERGALVTARREGTSACRVRTHDPRSTGEVGGNQELYTWPQRASRTTSLWCSVVQAHCSSDWKKAHRGSCLTLGGGCSVQPSKLSRMEGRGHAQAHLMQAGSGRGGHCERAVYQPRNQRTLFLRHAISGIISNQSNNSGTGAHRARGKPFT